MTLLMFMEGQLIKLPIYTVSCSHISGKFQFSCSTCTLGLQVQCRSSQLHISHKTCIQLCIDGLFYSGSILKQSLFLCPSSSTHTWLAWICSFFLLSNHLSPGLFWFYPHPYIGIVLVVFLDSDYALCTGS